LFWRFGGQSAIRRGDWKLVKAAGDSQYRLINLAKDIGEKTDVTEQNADLAREMRVELEKWLGTLAPPIKY
jgi:arylsulfatase A-like enzyme